MPIVRPLELDGVVEIIPDRFGDERGFFSETYNTKSLADAGIALNFVQDNHSFSAGKGVLRGLHFQTPPHAQDKLVRVTHGSVFDVIVDIRKGSPTYSKWIGIEVSAEKWNQVLIPKGFAHGFITLEPNTEFLYKVSDYYSPNCDHSIRFDDPAIGVVWPVDASQITLSEKDRNAGILSETESGFSYEG
jgi:dTDP-4-dehydrorhamnose 3,5-epimerase